MSKRNNFSIRFLTLHISIPEISTANFTIESTAGITPFKSEGEVGRVYGIQYLDINFICALV